MSKVKNKLKRGDMVNHTTYGTGTVLDLGETYIRVRYSNATVTHVDEWEGDIIKLEGERQEWYAVPPYNIEGWRIINQDGELVAIFELKEDCLLAVELHQNMRNGDK